MTADILHYIAVALRTGLFLASKKVPVSNRAKYRKIEERFDCAAVWNKGCDCGNARKRYSP
jgi:hypothetical protein